MADRFRALAARGTVDFECWFNRARNRDRTWIVEDRGFPHVFVPSAPLTRGAVGLPIERYAATRPRILVTFHADPAVSVANLQGVLPQARLIFYVMKTFDEWTPRSAAKEATKRVLFSNADGFLSPGADADQYIRHYARRDAPITRLQPVLQVEHYRQALKLRTSPETTERRRELGLEGFVFLNVGRMLRQKGIHTLLDAYSRVRAQGIRASLLLVGDGGDRDEFVRETQKRGIPNVRFLDFVQQEALPEIYALGDCFVFPTRGDPYGIVVDEAMASGLPIITSDHAGELGPRVREGENGAIVPIDDAGALAGAMSGLASDLAAASRMGDRSRQLISGRTIDTWVDSIEAFVGATLNESDQ